MMGAIIHMLMSSMMCAFDANFFNVQSEMVLRCWHPELCLSLHSTGRPVLVQYSSGCSWTRGVLLLVPSFLPRIPELSQRVIAIRGFRGIFLPGLSFCTTWQRRGPKVRIEDLIISRPSRGGRHAENLFLDPVGPFYVFWHLIGQCIRLAAKHVLNRQ